MDFLEIDGSEGEGGGQILRLSVGLSAVTGKPVRVTNIRASRNQPGLKAQHLRSIEAIATSCNARISGFSEGSTQIEFMPCELDQDHMRIDIGTAGSIGLVFQSLMIPAVHTERPVEFEVIGGTDVLWSPSVTYFREVFLSILKKMGIEAEVDIQRYGFYPQGGGRVLLRVHPGNLRSLSLVDRTRLVRYDLLSVASEQLRGARVAERQAEAATEILGRRSEQELREYYETECAGSSMHIHAHFENTILGATVLGERGKPSEAVGKECAEQVLREVESGACLDRWMGDQILPYMALTGKPCEASVSQVSNHARTSMRLIERFLPVEFREKESGKHFIISSRPV